MGMCPTNWFHIPVFARNDSSDSLCLVSAQNVFQMSEILSSDIERQSYPNPCLLDPAISGFGKFCNRAFATSELRPLRAS